MLCAYSFPFKAKRSLRFSACGEVNCTFLVVPFGFFHLTIIMHCYLLLHPSSCFVSSFMGSKVKQNPKGITIEGSKVKR